MTRLGAPLLGLLLTFLPAGAQEGRFSSRYQVEVSGQRLPVLSSYEKKARKLDRNHDRLVSAKELAVETDDLPGDLRVEVEDFVVGLGHEMSGTTSSYASGYPSAVEIESQLAELQAAYPSLIHLEPLGTSPEGRPITAARVGLEDGVPRPKIAVVAQQHAREWLTHQVAMASLRALVENPVHQDLLRTCEIVIVPLANPDGYEYSRLVQPMWRKNRREATAEKSAGVDLNRNFAATFRRAEDTAESFEDDWGGSDHPRSEQYRGTAEASEPETRDLQALLDRPGMVAALDLHGFGCKIVLPDAGHTVAAESYQAVAETMLKALGPEYEILRFRELYPITGHLTGYADQRGILSITLEMGKAFQPNPAKLRALTQQGTRGVLAFARAAAGLRR